MTESRFYITIGSSVLTAAFRDTPAAATLKAQLEEGPLTLSAGGYGGFELVCPLGLTLPSRDTYITTRPGDIMLYNGSSVVLFYGSNTWSYTPLGTILSCTANDLNAVLSGQVSSVTLSLTNP